MTESVTHRPPSRKQSPSGMGTKTKFVFHTMGTMGIVFVILEIPCTPGPVRGTKTWVQLARGLSHPTHKKRLKTMRNLADTN